MTLHTLYRFYNASGDLLYVGITNNPPRRLGEHRDAKAWWQEVARIDMEQHPDRLALHTAERRAIETERPRHNIQLNSRSRSTFQELAERPPAPETWSFHDRYGRERVGLTIELYWEAHYDPISDDFTPDDIDAYELLRRWLAHLEHDDLSFYGLPARHVPVFWYLRFSASPGFEGAPFCENSEKLAASFGREDFFSYFTWPTSDLTGQPLNFLALPVCDKLWNRTQANKGGFIQEALDWKPAAYQVSFDPWAMARRAGLL